MCERRFRRRLPNRHLRYRVLGGDVDLKNMVKPLHFSVFLVVSTKKEPVVEFSTLVQSLSEKMLKKIHE